MSKRSPPTDALTGSTGAGTAPPEPTVAKRTRSSGGGSAATAAPPAAAAAPPPPMGVTFSVKDSAQQLGYSRDALEVTGAVGGYRMARATDGVFSGNWYWEAEVLLPEEAEGQGQGQGQQEGRGDQQQEQEGAEDGDGAASESGNGNAGAADSGSAPHFRLGWALRQADTQAPCGYDKNSYGYRDVDGAKVHQSLREDGYGEPFGPGDVIGFGICLPILPEHMQEILALNDGVLPAYMRGTEDDASRADAAPGAEAGTGAAPPLSKEEKEALEKELAALGNHIRFFKNGVDQGPAYSQLIGAKYFPAASVYNEGGRVRANFGPAWICDPKAHGCRIDFRPVSAVKEPLRKEELAAYLGYIEARRAAWRARHGVKEEKQEEGEARERER